jgi:hypothetical protein
MGRKVAKKTKKVPTTGQMKNWKRMSVAHDLKKNPKKYKKPSQEKRKVPTDHYWWYLR